MEANLLDGIAKLGNQQEIDAYKEEVTKYYHDLKQKTEENLVLRQQMQTLQTQFEQDLRAANEENEIAEVTHTLYRHRTNVSTDVNVHVNVNVYVHVYMYGQCMSV